MFGHLRGDESGDFALSNELPCHIVDGKLGDEVATSEVVRLQKVDTLPSPREFVPSGWAIYCFSNRG